MYYSFTYIPYKLVYIFFLSIVKCEIKAHTRYNYCIKLRLDVISYLFSLKELFLKIKWNN